MTDTPRTIASYMTRVPIQIQIDDDLERASQLMEQHAIRHLPVLDGRQLAGVVSDRDLSMIETLLPTEWERIRVSEAMTPEPFAVGPDTGLWEVARTMAREKYGCAIVVENDDVVGVFTTVDALRALADVIESEHGERGQG